MVDNGSIVNVWFLNQLQENGVAIPPLEEATFKIWAYDSSLKKPLGISTLLFSIGFRTISTKFEAVYSKLSYNIILGWPWIHDIEGIPSTLHMRLKFAFQEEVHTILTDPEPYALCNAIDF